jgi:hypothetical protein
MVLSGLEVESSDAEAKNKAKKNVKTINKTPTCTKK